MAKMLYATAYGFRKPVARSTGNATVDYQIVKQAEESMREAGRKVLKVAWKFVLFGATIAIAAVKTAGSILRKLLTGLVLSKPSDKGKSDGPLIQPLAITETVLTQLRDTATVETKLLTKPELPKLPTTVAPKKPSALAGVLALGGAALGVAAKGVFNDEFKEI